MIYSRKKASLPLIFQSEATECSLACLAMIFGYHGCNISIRRLRERFPISLEGMHLKAVVEIARNMGFQAVVQRCDLGKARHLPMGTMLHWNMDHFVVFHSFRKGIFTIHDPATGVQRLTETEFSRHFSGICVDYKPIADFTAPKSDTALGLLTFLRLIRFSKKSILWLIAITLVVEFFMLTQPWLLKTAIDGGLSQHNHQKLFWATALMVAAACGYAIASYVRNCTILQYGARMNLEIMDMLFHRLMNLELAYFEKRSTGDVIERFRSSEAIKQFTIGSLPQSIIDGVFSLATLGVIFWMLPLGGIVALCCVGLLLFLKLYQLKDKVAEQRRISRYLGMEDGNLIEALQNIYTIRNNGGEVHRWHKWRRHRTDVVRHQLRLGVLGQRELLVKNLVVGLNVSLFLAVFVQGVTNASLGVFFGALFYSSHFIARSTNFIENIFQVHWLNVSLERLEDIVFARVQQKPVYLQDDSPFMFSVQGLAFRYGHGTAPVIANLSLSVRAGEFVVVSGKNGVGKTTLLKLMTGLYVPDEGTVTFNPGGASGSGDKSHHFAIVHQNDTLLQGTLEENITMFDATPDRELLLEAIRMACLEGDILSLTMGLRTPLGQLGAPLSAGQKQKIYIARAIYRRPRILFMDEGTSNLDLATERTVLENLSTLACAKILVTHRPAAFDYADSLYELVDGHVLQVTAACADPAQGALCM